MRLTSLLCFILAGLLAGCAIEGVVVEKSSRPLPFVDSIGMDGIYKFKLRDAQGHICSQMVTPEIFARYEVGDHFSDLQPAERSPVHLEEVRTVPTVQRVSHHAGKRSKVAHLRHGRKIARVHHGKKTRHAHHSKKHSSKAQARHGRLAAKARLRSA